MLGLIWFKLYRWSWFLSDWLHDREIAYKERHSDPEETTVRRVHGVRLHH